jgi:hypothetical protein
MIRSPLSLARSGSDFVLLSPVSVSSPPPLHSSPPEQDTLQSSGSSVSALNTHRTLDYVGVSLRDPGFLPSSSLGQRTVPPSSFSNAPAGGLSLQRGASLSDSVSDNDHFDLVSTAPGGDQDHSNEVRGPPIPSVSPTITHRANDLSDRPGTSGWRGREAPISINANAAASLLRGVTPITIASASDGGAASAPIPGSFPLVDPAVNVRMASSTTPAPQLNNLRSTPSPPADRETLAEQRTDKKAGGGFFRSLFGRKKDPDPHPEPEAVSHHRPLKPSDQSVDRGGGDFNHRSSVHSQHSFQSSEEPSIQEAHPRQDGVVVPLEQRTNGVSLSLRPPTTSLAVSRNEPSTPKVHRPRPIPTGLLDSRPPTRQSEASPLRLGRIPPASPNRSLSRTQDTVRLGHDDHPRRVDVQQHPLHSAYPTNNVSPHQPLLPVRAPRAGLLGRPTQQGLDRHDSTSTRLGLPQNASPPQPSRTVDVQRDLPSQASGSATPRYVPRPLGPAIDPPRLRSPSELSRTATLHQHQELHFSSTTPDDHDDDRRVALQLHQQYAEEQQRLQADRQMAVDIGRNLAEEAREAQMQRMMLRDLEEAREQLLLQERVQVEQPPIVERREPIEATSHPQEVFNCSICQDEHEVVDLAQIDECEHVFGRECLLGYIRNRIQTNVYPIVCPDCQTDQGDRAGEVGCKTYIGDRSCWLTGACA